MGYEVVERHIKPEELENVTECFLTGTAAEVTPVSQIGIIISTGWFLPVSHGWVYQHCQGESASPVASGHGRYYRSRGHQPSSLHRRALLLSRRARLF